MYRGPSQRADATHRVEQAALLVARREIGVAGRLDALSDLVQAQSSVRVSQ